MTGSVDLIVIGAGPAGMAAATEAQSFGLSVLVLDEQTEPGGQIYRNIGRNGGKSSAFKNILGRDYLRGRHVAEDFDRAGVEYKSGATVWQVDPDGAVSYSHEGVAQQASGKRILLATGAMERPVPIPGWTLPGVMGAGAAQVLLKSAGAVPQGKVALAGSGPLLLLVAQQLIDAGADLVAVLETTQRSDYFRAASKLPQALRASDYLRKGISMRLRVRESKVPIYSGVRGLAAEGGDRVERLRFRHRGTDRDVAVDTLLLHEGVVPNLQITRALGCEHEWFVPQRYWRPVLDDWFNTTVPSIAVAGDSAGIFGAEAAVLAGRIAALEAAHALEKLPLAERDSRAAPLRRQMSKHLAIRPLLDALFPPNPETLVPSDDSTVVCRCEEVTAGTIREGVALGGTGPNQLKSYMRCGMGPCQGRLCGLTVSEIIAAARGVSVADVGYYRIRPPIKPVTLEELAAFGE